MSFLAFNVGFFLLKLTAFEIKNLSQKHIKHLIFTQETETASSEFLWSLGENRQLDQNQNKARLLDPGDTTAASGESAVR